MKKILLILLILLFSTVSYSAVYLGGSYGTSMFASDSLEEYKVSAKGPTYGGFLGFGRDFVGVEAFYQSITSMGDIKHDGGTHTLESNAMAMGAALRFSFEFFYLRLGMARYTLDQSIDIEDDSSRDAAEEIYDIQEEDTKKNGVLYGAGLHFKIKSIRLFIDYSRYQINTIGNYDTFSAGLSFNLPDGLFDRLFSPGKY